MQSLSTIFMELAERIALHPQLYASTPEEANGMIVIVTATILHDSSGKPIENCIREVSELVWESMKGVYPSKSIVACLAEDSFPEGNSSFAVFERNCKNFIDLFQKKITAYGQVDLSPRNILPSASARYQK